MEIFQTNLDLYLQRINLERSSMMRDRYNYIQHTWNANREDRRQIIIDALAHIQHIDSYILNMRNRVSTTKSFFFLLTVLSVPMPFT